MIQGYTAAWAQSQGDEPGFAKTNHISQGRGSIDKKNLQYLMTTPRLKAAGGR